MEMPKTIQPTTRHEWRNWLRRNYGKEKEVWLVFFRSHTGKPHVAYEEAVEEALCFGWVDSIIQPIDDKKYARKFTPRSAKSKWSASNLRRLSKLMEQGLMTPAGLAKAKLAPPRDKAAEAEQGRPEPEPELSPALHRALSANQKAWESFRNLPPSHRRKTISWIMSAKKDETRDRRLREAMELLSQGKRLGMK